MSHCLIGYSSLFRACPGKVETGFPKRTCDNRNLERFPIPLNREVLQARFNKSAVPLNLPAQAGLRNILRRTYAHSLIR
jgi:hypothetical protein